VNSEFNRDIFSRLNCNTYHFGNAVDPAFFGTPCVRSGTVKVGYLGWVTKRTDVAILEHIAAAKPECQVLGAAPGTVQAREHLRIAADGPGFVRAIEETLVNDTPNAARRRVEAVVRETWELRVRSMLEPIFAGWAERTPSRVVAGNEYYQSMRL